MLHLRLMLAAALLGGCTCLVHADAFDDYTNPILAKAPQADGVVPVTELTAELIAKNDNVLPDAKGAVVVVATNDRRWAKLLVVAARQKVPGRAGAAAQIVPILRIERFMTYREASERAVQAEGKAISLFAGFHFHLDLGQVVPEKLGGDIAVVAAPAGHCVVQAVGAAKMYLLTKALPDAVRRKSDKFTFGGKFEPKYFNGVFKLHDDGRRSGTLRLKITEDNDVQGTFVSDRDGREYEVRGSIAKPNHKILFTIQFPQTVQSFEGHMFAGDGKAMAGTSKMQERDAGFYALRVPE